MGIGVLKLFSRSEKEGQSLVEYAFVLLLVATVAIAALLATGSNVNNVIQGVSSSLTTVT
jgi:Flp pilus assembly pilin Flp